MDPIRVIPNDDLALDREAMKAEGIWEEFLERRDVSLARFVDGERPTIYVATWPTRKQVETWTALTLDARHKAAFRECVKSVDGLLFPDGSRRAWSKPGDASRPMRDDSLELFAYSHILEVGHVIWAHGFFPRDKPLYVPLLASSRDAMIAAGIESQRRRAARMRAQGADPSSDAKPSPEAPPPATP